MLIGGTRRAVLLVMIASFSLTVSGKKRGRYARSEFVLAGEEKLYRQAIYHRETKVKFSPYFSSSLLENEINCMHKSFPW